MKARIYKQIIGSVYNHDLSESPIAWKTRLKIFKRTNLTWDPQTGIGYSYHWYEIAKVIKGQLVLNTYRYSVSTAKHVRLLRNLFDFLELSYVEIDAPSGLQNLNNAAIQCASQWAKLIVKNKYAHKPLVKAEINARKMYNLTLKLGAVHNQNMSDIVDNHESFRREDLNHKKVKNVTRSQKPIQAVKLQLINGGAI